MSDQWIDLARAELVAFCNEVEEGRAWAKESRRGLKTPLAPFLDHQVIFSDHACTALHLRRNRRPIFFETTCLAKSTISDPISIFVGEQYLQSIEDRFLFSYGDFESLMYVFKYVSFHSQHPPSSILSSINLCTSLFPIKKRWYCRNDHWARIG